MVFDAEWVHPPFADINPPPSSLQGAEPELEISPDEELEDDELLDDEEPVIEPDEELELVDEELDEVELLVEFLTHIVPVGIIAFKFDVEVL